MDALMQLIAQYGLWLVFASVLLDQGGVPVPAYPILIVASATVAPAAANLGAIVLVAVLAAVLADALWYSAGRRFGGSMIRLICRVSLSPETCVGTTRGLYARWGAPSLIVAKFIPGVAAVATTLAGQTGTGFVRFAFYDGIGATLWTGVAVTLGVLFHDAVQDVLLRLASLGRVGLLLLLVAVAVYVALKAWRRWRFLRLIRMARITPDELRQLMASGVQPLILDVRAATLRQASGWIPGAVRVGSIAELDLAAQPEVVIYCDCPNEASAAMLARQLKSRGFQHVRPLAGGFEAWHAQGLPVAHAARDATVDSAEPQTSLTTGTLHDP